MRRSVARIVSNDSGAVAPTVALSLVALIAAGGIAFVYARMAAMDTELQNAADQAALAAASQLDKKTGACARASAAAVTLVSNQTRFADRSGGIAVTVPSEPTCDGVGNIRFYTTAAKTTVATTDGTARFVEVTVNSRTATYALTPIVGAFTSGALTGTAFAGMGSAICKVPPLMICNPNPGAPFNSTNYPWDATPGWRGVGLKLFQGGQGEAWAPGAFGYLDVGADNSGSPDQRIALAMDNPNTNCVADAGVEVDTGVSATVLDAVNVRFDLFENGWPRNTCYPDADCSSAYNSTKDIIRTTGTGGAANVCGFNAANASGWTLPPANDQYIAQNAAGDDSQITHMGYPMDVCHYPSGGSCGTTNQRFGNGYWRRDLYFKVNHGSLTADGTNWVGATGLSPNATRYDVYRWEQRSAGNPGNTLGSLPEVTANGMTQYSRAVCKPEGLAPGGSQPDRRIVAVAVANNCDALQGGSVNVDVGAWVEVFLVQPSVDRPDAGVDQHDIYVEIAGPANPTGSGATAQVVVRDVPYLIE